MPYKLDGFPEQFWTVWERAATGEELAFDFAPGERSAATNTVHQLRSFRRALLDGKATKWHTLASERQMRAAALCERISQLAVTGPVKDKAGFVVRIVPDWKKPAVEFLGRARTEYVPEPGSVNLDAEIASSIERLKNLNKDEGEVS